MNAAKKTDYSSADYIPISDGDLTIWQGFDYFKHSTNLESYSTMASETKQLTNHFPLSHMKKLLDADVEHINTLLATLNVHHRHARSINLLGTALKVIAGTPNFDDFEKLKFRQQELINSKNRQVTINSKT